MKISLLILGFIGWCGAWVDGEHEFFAPDPYGLPMITKSFVGRLNISQGFSLGPNMFWSDNLHHQNAFNLANFPPKLPEALIGGEKARPIMYTLEHEDIYADVEKPIHLSDFKYCPPHYECPITIPTALLSKQTISTRFNDKQWLEKFMSPFNQIRNPYITYNVHGSGIWSIYYKPIALTVKGVISETDILTLTTISTPFIATFPMTRNNLPLFLIIQET
ncbi:hypothetical protein DSO57_1030680 [Entomophthora muscae]|uniref:Uncharacterized protein n=1 Tax=Entomophthora muscae TaxID=34485 RepID=A0ACC2S2X8_9FUNG|nr:hypothetical protein DSO57_1030680 [Entomophthora muscae]